MSNALSLLHRMVEIGQHSHSGQDHKKAVFITSLGQRLIMIFGKLIMSRIQNDVIAVWIV